MKINNQFLKKRHLQRAGLGKEVGEKNLLRTFFCMFSAPSRELDASTHLLINTREADVDRITMNVWTAQTNKVLTESLTDHKHVQLSRRRVRRSGPPAAAPPQPPGCVSWPPAGESSPTWRTGGTAPLQRGQVSASTCAPAGCASPVLEGGVGTGVLHQEADDLRMAFSRSHMQSRPAVVVHGFHVHSRQEVPEDIFDLA